MNPAPPVIRHRMRLFLARSECKFAKLQDPAPYWEDNTALQVFRPSNGNEPSSSRCKNIQRENFSRWTNAEDSHGTIRQATGRRRDLVRHSSDSTVTLK